MHSGKKSHKDLNSVKVKNLFFFLISVTFVPGDLSAVNHCGTVPTDLTAEKDDFSQQEEMQHPQHSVKVTGMYEALDFYNKGL